MIGAIVRASRPISWINTAFPFAAAYLMAVREVDAVLVVGTLFFLVPYNVLMYGINDVFDYESDLRNPRKGSIEGVVLDRRWHRTTIWAAVLSNLPFLVTLVILGDATATAVLAVSVFAVLAYSVPMLRFKERPLLDSATSSTHFVSPAVFGLVLVGGDLDMTALAARHHGVRFMVVVPVSTIDLATPNGEAIPIEQRPPAEVLAWGGTPVAAAGAGAWNPAFDITPAALVDALVTERGVVLAPDREKIATLVAERSPQNLQ